MKSAILLSLILSISLNASIFGGGSRQPTNIPIVIVKETITPNINSISDSSVSSLNRCKNSDYASAMLYDTTLQSLLSQEKSLLGNYKTSKTVYSNPIIEPNEKLLSLQKQILDRRKTLALNYKNGKCTQIIMSGTGQILSSLYR